MKQYVIYLDNRNKQFSFMPKFKELISFDNYINANYWVMEHTKADEGIVFYMKIAN